MPESSQPLLLSRQKVCQMLSITHREFYALVTAGKLHPVHTQQRHIRVPLAQVMALKAEFAHRALALPYQKFIEAVTCFADNAKDVNYHLINLSYPQAPSEFIDRMRILAKEGSKEPLIRQQSIGEFYRAIGRADEIVKRPDLRLLVELLTMINRGEQEIVDTIRAKYGREYGKADILRFQEYFWNWRIMDPESVKFYFEFLQGREKILKECAYNRADYFIFYALGIDFGGEVAELLERSCLGLIHKLNFLIDSYVYGNAAVSQKDLKGISDIISNLLGASQSVRAGKIPKGKQGPMVDDLIPRSVSRQGFFETENRVDFGKPN